MWIRVRLPHRVGFRKFFSEYMHIKSFEIFLYIYLELRKPGQQTFCNFSQLPLSNGLFTELFAYVVFFWFLLWFGLCVDVAVDRISNFYLPPSPLHHHHHHHFYSYTVKRSGKYTISLPLFLFFSSYPQFRVTQREILRKRPKNNNKA